MEPKAAGKNEFVGLVEAYHGDTVGGMSVGRTTAFHRPYGAMLFKTHFAPAPVTYRAAVGTTHASPEIANRRPAGDACVAPTMNAVRDCAVAGLRAILEQHAPASPPSASSRW